MNSLKIPSLLLVFLLCSCLALSKDFVFSVISIKGTVEIQKNNSGKWEPLKIATKIGTNDKIRLTNNSTVNLAHSSGKTIEVESPDEYTAAQLAMQVPSGGGSVGSKLAKSVLDDMSKSDNMLSKGNKKKITSVTGAGERGLTFIKVNSSKKVHYLTPDITFYWFKTEGVPVYKFLITDINDTPVYTTTTKDSNFTFDTDSLGLKRDVYYFWYVAAGDDPSKKSDNVSFQILSDNNVAVINDSLEIIKREINAEQSAFQQVVIAKFYENNFLIPNAAKAYEKAISIAPDVDEYLNLYKRFTVNNNYTVK
jgi:hypothetical protein